MSLFHSTEIPTILMKHFDNLPRKGRGEIGRLAAHLRVNSSLVSQVLAGTRNFTPEQGQLLSTYLECTPLETEYLLLIILRDRAGSEDLRAFFRSRLNSVREEGRKVASRVTVDRSLTDHERAVFYSSPLFAAIALYLTVGERGKSLDEIAERFQLSAADARSAMSFLMSSGLCKLEKGNYREGVQKTHLEAGSPFLPRHHCNWRLRAIKRSEDLSASELMYSAPVSLSKKDFEILREEMLQFIQAFLKRVHASPAEDVACLNMDWFWFKQ